ncbi:unnamed protein product [Spirodela intermedia]|uniref:Uncharacterized protein n=1 Tax=Spirodela intermedia TaxID=51605 RepID=A0A7I8J7C5_SPIIN|nr:unnamed protein product [Spirodela intermedia]CAA6666136.1 unnamed protein product [Spirodela intermedia]
MNEEGNGARAGGDGGAGVEPTELPAQVRGCLPCAPVQVPAAAARAQLQYANYEPEGWKCQCGSSFYNP